MGFGYHLYPSYGDRLSGETIDEWGYKLMAKHDGLPALPIEGRLLFFHGSACGASGAGC